MQVINGTQSQKVKRKTNNKQLKVNSYIFGGSCLYKPSQASFVSCIEWAFHQAVKRHSGELEAPPPAGRALWLARSNSAAHKQLQRQRRTWADHSCRRRSSDGVRSSEPPVSRKSSNFPSGSRKFYCSRRENEFQQMSACFLKSSREAACSVLRRTKTKQLKFCFKF